MRKVLVLSAAVAAACASAAVVSPGVEAAAAPAEPVGPTPTTTTQEPVSATPEAPQEATKITAGSQVETAQAFIVTLPRLRTARYSYGPDADQQIDAYLRSPAEGTQPAVLLLHGGSWLTGDKSSWRRVAHRLAADGYAVFSADYRLSGEAPWPAQRDDAEAALAFIKRHAERFKVDPARVVVIGSSAGGQLATMLGTYGAGAQKVSGVVALSPVNSPYLAYLDGALPGASSTAVKLRGAVEQLIGCTPQEIDTTCWQRIEDVAPATHADRGDAPMLIMHSADEFVPTAHSTELVAELKGYGVPVTLKEVPGTGHAMTIIKDPAAWRTLITWIDSIAKKPAG
ncbi:alpha/beta hydrolase [Actinomadura alba]|uniref:alpha/beta hydrolase n=1 Tax=Actinomadura alba TaxID=406431 RepID=UPI0028ABA2D3|nr:alpha/beta hydrolase [Actinomadura alba]